MTSELRNVSCGVPQGSVLGPLLFLLYINDIANSSDIFKFHLFADDSNLFYADKSLMRLETIVNHQLNNVANWLYINKLSLNIDKSNFIIFHPPQKILNYDVNIIINNCPLKHLSNTSYLGVVMDCHLNWKAQNF